MRDCPHCSQEIQDEAIYCRHCRRDLEPPMWITSMHKCPYCAEWIELELEKCQYCERHIGIAEQEPAAPFVDTVTTDFTQDLRQSLLKPKADSPLDREMEPAPEPTPAEPAIPAILEEPVTEFVAQPSAEPAFETQSSIWATEAEGLGEYRSEEPEPERPPRSLPAGIIQGLIGIVLIGGLGYGLFALAQGPAGAFIADTLATDIPTETPIPLPTVTRRPAPTLPPVTEAVVVEITETAVPDCLLWDQITLENEGEELCAYGVIRRWFAVGEIPFVAIFSEDLGTFAIIDRTTTHPVGPGMCIAARGVVEVMGGTRPNINVAGELEPCPEEVSDG